MRRLAATCLIASLVGCGAATAPPEPEPSGDASKDVTVGFAGERWGIGTSWYDYDGTTHAVTPKPLVYAVTDGDEETFVELLGYYDERGTSGFPTLSDGAETLTVSSNVKEAPVCLAFAPLRETPCDDDAEMVFATKRRPLPDGELSVLDPGLWMLPVEGREVWRINADSIAAVPDDWRPTAERIPSAAADPSQSRMSALSGVHLVVTADLRLAAFEVQATDAGFVVGAICGSADYDRDQPLADATARTVEVRGGPGAYAVAICDERASDAQRWLGLWLEGHEYELDLQLHEGGEATVRLSPEVLHWRWASEGGVEDARDALVWEGYLP